VSSVSSTATAAQRRWWRATTYYAIKVSDTSYQLATIDVQTLLLALPSI
jgi:hypothetical protein